MRTGFSALALMALGMSACGAAIDFVDPLIGTEGSGSEYGGMQPMVGVPFGSMHLVPMTRTNGIARVSFNAEDQTLLGFILTRQPAIWMGDWGAVRILLAKPQSIESLETHPHYAKVRAGGKTYELTASAHVALIRTDDPTLGANLAAEGFTAERMIRTGSNPLPNFRCDWTKTWRTNVLEVAVSLLGAAQAKANRAELPMDFDAAVRQTKAVWEERFDRMQIEATDEVKTIFYTGLYHAHHYPREITEAGRHYSGLDDRTHAGVGFACYSLWDTYRAEHPLLTLVAPDRVDAMMQGLVNIYREGGWLPIHPNPGYTGQMIGGHAEVVLAEAYVKGFRGFDVAGAWEAVFKNATVPQVGDLDYNWPALLENRAGPPETRGGLTRYLKNGYVSREETDESVSRTLDYAFDDAAVAAFARALGKPEVAERFARRSKNYTNLWNAAEGVFLPRRVNGEWMSPSGYTETNPKTARWCVPHDVPGLVRLLGGKEAFVRELDDFFDHDFFKSDHIGLSVHGNETAHHLAYLYNAVGEYDRTCRRVRDILTKCYSAGHRGFDGNEDCGQMSAWYVLSALGFYPVDPASGFYELGSPIVHAATLRFVAPYAPTTLRITVKNGTPSRYRVRRVTLNGRELKDRRVAHAELVKGGELVFEMGD